jgi:hypothetical protein
MKKQSLSSLVVFLAGASLALTSCRYPADSLVANPRAGAAYQATGNGPLGAAADSALGSNRDDYYYVKRNRGTGSRAYYSSTRYPSSAPTSYYRHHYFSNSSHSSPYYSRSSSSSKSTTTRPWGGGYGIGQPFNGSIGFGIGSRWF